MNQTNMLIAAGCIALATTSVQAAEYTSMMDFLSSKEPDFLANFGVKKNCIITGLSCGGNGDCCSVNCEHNYCQAASE